MPISPNAALVIIDVQKAMDDPRWGVGRNNPALEANLAKLLDVRLVADACATVERRDYNGKEWSADDVHALALANMHGEYATVCTTVEILAALTAA